MKTLRNLVIFLLVLAGLGWAFVTYGPAAYVDPLRHGYAAVSNRLFPCSQPKTYSFGNFDARFQISQADFEAAVGTAAAAWEDAVGRRLFEPVDRDGALTVNLTYDSRQAATDQLRQLGVVIDDDKATYDRLKARLGVLKAQIDPIKSELDSAGAALKQRQAAYTQAVADWNRKGGAPKGVYEQLSAERDAINDEAARLNALGKTLNAQISEYNSTVTVVNRLAKALNLAAADYNGVAGARGAEFEEGLFTGNEIGGTVDIYEFDSQRRLVRLLEHELGHALGLGHLDDPNAIMYRLNSGTGTEPNPTDIAALKQICRIN